MVISSSLELAGDENYLVLLDHFGPWVGSLPQGAVLLDKPTPDLVQLGRRQDTGHRCIERFDSLVKLARCHLRHETLCPLLMVVRLVAKGGWA